jgi:hypothetical protein
MKEGNNKSPLNSYFVTLDYPHSERTIVAFHLLDFSSHREVRGRRAPPRHTSLARRPYPSPRARGRGALLIRKAQTAEVTHAIRRTRFDPAPQLAPALARVLPPGCRALPPVPRTTRGAHEPPGTVLPVQVREAKRQTTCAPGIDRCPWPRHDKSAASTMPIRKGLRPTIGRIGRRSPCSGGLLTTTSKR